MARSGGPVQARFDFSAKAFARPNLGPQHIKSGLNGVAMPPFGLILSGSTAKASGMPLGALGAPKRPQIYKKTTFMFFGSLGGGLPLGIPIVLLRDAHCYCHPIVPFAGCRYVAFLPTREVASWAPGAVRREVREKSVATAAPPTDPHT